MNPGTDISQAEDRIETVLAGLRHAEPAPGMNHRIHAALLRERDAAAAPSRWTGLGVPQMTSLALVAALVLLAVQVYRRHPAGPVQQRIAVSAIDRQNGPSQQGSAPPPVRGAEAGKAIRAAHVMSVAKPSGSRTAEVIPPAVQTSAEQGFPPPPLPLTEQERLLVRLVHRDDPVELAQLAPSAREIALQRDREQVREFFKAPPMLAANFITLEPYPTNTGGTQ